MRDWDTAAVTSAAEVIVETAWVQSASARRKGWLAAIMDLLSLSEGQGASILGSTGDPKWRLTIVVRETGAQIAHSAWRHDWPEVERLQASWQQDLASLTPDEVVRNARRWDGR